MQTLMRFSCGSHAFYLFSSTRLINSIKHETPVRSSVCAYVVKYWNLPCWLIFNPLPHMLYLEHCIISINNSNIFQNNNFYISIVLKILWKMEHLLLRSKCSIFHNIFKNLTFQRRPKVLVWSKGLFICVKDAFIWKDDSAINETCYYWN